MAVGGDEKSVEAMTDFINYILSFCGDDEEDYWASDVFDTAAKLIEKYDGESSWPQLL